MTGGVDGEFPSRTGTAVDALPGLYGASGTGVGDEGAAPAAGGRAMAGESMDPARRPGNNTGAGAAATE